MIGRSLRDRGGVAALSEERARVLLDEALAAHGALIVQVRAQGERMIACVVVRATAEVVKQCRALGFRVTLGGGGVFGLFGEDAARLFATLPEARRAWLEAPCGLRETKVLLIEQGVAFVSIETEGGKAHVRVVP